MATEQFDAVLAEMREEARERRTEDRAAGILPDHDTAEMLDHWADRLSAAHAAEVGELMECIDFKNRFTEAVANDLRAVGCSFDSNRTPIIQNDRAEAAERDATLREIEATLENCAASMTALRTRAEAAERLYAEIEPMYQQQGLNIVRLQKELEAAERDARTLASARLHLPTKVETSKLGDYTPEEMAAFDSGYNLALDRAHNLLNRAPGAIAAIATTEQADDPS